MCNTTIPRPPISTNLSSPIRFMSLHPPAFLIKLKIEMSMANLILKIARSNEFTNSPTCTTDSCELGYYSPEDDDSDNYNHNSVNYGVSKPVAAVENQEAGDLETGSQTSSRDQTIEFENDEQPLHLGVGEIEVMTSDRKN